MLPIVRTATLLTATLPFAAPVCAVVIPNDREHTATNDWFLGILSDARRTYQLIIDDSQLTQITGATIGGITWRQRADFTLNWPPAEVNYSSFEVRLSGGVEPSAR